MKIKDSMTTRQDLHPDTTVAEAAHLMWDGDCGILPVVDDGELVGVVTDRDMYIALATQDARASQLRWARWPPGTVATCAPEDECTAALATMRDARVRRLPVVGFGGTVLGMLSINDVLLAAGAGKTLGTEDVVETLQAICGHRQPAPHVVAA